MTSQSTSHQLARGVQQEGTTAPWSSSTIPSDLLLNKVSFMVVDSIMASPRNMISFLNLPMLRDHQRLLECVLGIVRPYEPRIMNTLRGGVCHQHQYLPAPSPRLSENFATAIMPGTATGNLDAKFLPTRTPPQEEWSSSVRGEMLLSSQDDLEPEQRSSSIASKQQEAVPRESTAQKSSLAIKWLYSLEELRRYKEQHGDCIVPRGYAANPKLASWVAEQRKQYKLMTTGNPSSITIERIQLLNELGFAWNAQEEAWKRQIGDLLAFSKENGHCHVPLNHKKYPKLGLWVKEQRRHYTLMKQGKQSHMNDERVKALTGIGFCWDTHEAAWMERFRELVDFKQEYGTCLVPSGYSENPKLGTWVQHQRRQYKRFREGKTLSFITKERIDALEKLGFIWNPREGRAGGAATRGPGATTTILGHPVSCLQSVSSSSTCSTRSSMSKELFSMEQIITPSPKRRRMS